MAIKTTIETDAGDTREVYIRINNIDGLNNHGAPCTVLFRAFGSRAAWNNRKTFMWERSIQFVPDVSQNIWKQAYDAFKETMTNPDNPLGTTVTGELTEVQ